MKGYEHLLYELVRRESGRKKSDTAIVIPSAEAPELLERHLSVLSKQKWRGFDVIIIGRAPRKKPQGMNVLIYSEKYPLGSSGGFGIGEILSYTLGYDYIINSDVDALPMSPDLVGRLRELAKRERIAIWPFTASFEKKGRQSIYGYSCNEYGICPREVFEKSGFKFFRFFKGAEDFEFEQRLIGEGLGRGEDSVRVKHKTHIFDYIALLSSKGNKHIYYKRSGIVAKILLAAHFLRACRPVKSAKYAFMAFFDVVKTQLFYSNVPDILVPSVWHGLFLNMDIPYPRRKSCLQPLESSPFGRGLELTLAGRGSSSNKWSGGIKGVGIVARVAGAALSGYGYLKLNEKFMREFGYLLPVLMLIKPVKYTDGKYYSTNMGKGRILLNVALTSLLSPLFLIAITTSVLKALMLEYPVKPHSLAKNLSEFRKYVAALKELDRQSSRSRG